jgi:acetylornithine deacetylase/succinyl-diaminopimelate desuccinylase-like protein
MVGEDANRLSAKHLGAKHLGAKHLVVASDDVVEWTRSFVRHPSPQTELFEHEPQVQSFISDQIVPLLRTLALPWRRDQMGNLLIELGPQHADRSLMLMAYAMTHPANRMVNPYAGELIEDSLGIHVRGRGVSEQKGSLAAALAAVKTAADRSTLKGRLVLVVSTAGETGRHDAAISICDALGYFPKLAVIVIGTTGRVALANKGRIDAVVTVRGKASHSSAPWAGVDAIAGARRVLDRVTAIDLGGKQHPGLGWATLTPTSVRSWPEATHTVQDEVRLVFDRRLLPGDDPQAAFAAIAAAADIGEPWRVATELGPVMYPAEIAPDGAFMRAVHGGCRRMGLASPATFHSNGALDAGLFCAHGGEAAMWGPGAVEQWHSEDERIAVADLIAGSVAYLGMIEEHLCR